MTNTVAHELGHQMLWDSIGVHHDEAMKGSLMMGLQYPDQTTALAESYFEYDAVFAVKLCRRFN